MASLVISQSVMSATMVNVRVSPMSFAASAVPRSSSRSIASFPKQFVDATVVRGLGLHVAPMGKSLRSSTYIKASAEAEVATESTATVEKAAEDKPAGKRQSKGSGKARQQRSVKYTLEQIKVGEVMPGVVRSLQPYGAFVDIGTTTDGLVHISQLTSGFVSDVSEVVAPNQEVQVRVLEVDLEKGRVSLSMRDPAAEASAAAAAAAAGADQAAKAPRGKVARRSDKKEGSSDKRAPRAEKKEGPELTKGQTITGTVKSVTSFGAFVDVGEGKEGLVHVSEMSEDPNVDPESVVKVGQEVKVRVLKSERGRISLSMKEKIDLKKINEEAAGSEPSVSQFELAFKRASLSPGYFRSLDPEEDKKAAPAAAAPAPAAKPAPAAPAAQAAPAAPVATPAPAAPAAPAPAPAAPAVAAKAAEPAGGISAKLVKELRELTGAGMMDCKKALMEVGNDLEEAKNYLRKKGIAGADKKAGRVAAEGAVGSLIHAGAGLGVLVEVNCETDFVARGDIFKRLVEDIAAQVAGADNVPYVSVDEVPADATGDRAKLALLEQPFIKDGKTTLGEHIKKVVSETGENVKLRRFRRFVLAPGSHGAVGSYIHMGARIGVLIEVDCESDKVAKDDRFKAFVSDMAMQVAANQQVEFVSSADVPKDFVERERAIESQKEDLLSKPEAIRAKMVDGRIKKLVSERSLLEQPFIKDPTINVAEVVKRAGADMGEKVSVKRFERYILGEGIEKKVSDFAAEVAAFTNKA